jgi:signal transduction histidine kinase
VAILIKDNGCGISGEDLPQIFQPFYTTKHIGTGLGLSIVSRILSAHQGRCEVSSRVNEGSTFTVFLPAAEGEHHGS